MNTKMLKYLVIQVVFLLTSGFSVNTNYVFSLDGKVASVQPTALPQEGINIKTGYVVTNMTAISPTELSNYGWYRVISPSVSLDCRQYVVVTGYVFNVENSTATALKSICDNGPQKKYTQYRIIGLLMKLGLWDSAKQMLIESNAYDLFMGAQYLTNDDPNFFAAKKTLAQKMGLDDETVDAMLDLCIDEE